MTGKGHLATGAIASSYLLYIQIEPVFSVFIALGILVGSVFPDRIEKIGSLRILPHRGVSHWLGLWVAILAFLLFYISKNGMEGNELLFIALGLSIGSILHILGDIPNYQKVPIFSPTPSFSLGLWKSGQHEWLILMLLITPHAAIYNEWFIL